MNAYQQQWYQRGYDDGYQDGILAAERLANSTIVVEHPITGERSPVEVTRVAPQGTGEQGVPVARRPREAPRFA